MTLRKPRKIPKTYRLEADSITKLEALASNTHDDNTGVIEKLIDAAYNQLLINMSMYNKSKSIRKG